jgi:hypothetical protein
VNAIALGQFSLRGTNLDVARGLEYHLAEEISEDPGQLLHACLRQIVDNWRAFVECLKLAELSRTAFLGCLSAAHLASPSLSAAVLDALGLTSDTASSGLDEQSSGLSESRQSRSIAS